MSECKFKVGDLVYYVNESKNCTYPVVRVGSKITVLYEGEEYQYTRDRLVLVKSKYPNPPHKHAELIKAWADGAEIQVKGFNNKWKDLSEVCANWSESSHYRIKPQKSDKDLEIERIESEMRKLADALTKVKES